MFGCVWTFLYLCNTNMEQRYNTSININPLREFCEQHGEVIDYRKGERMECEGEPARWFAFVEKGCFKYVTRGISDGQEHITWFSFEGELVGDYPNLLYNTPAKLTIEAMTPCRVLRTSGENLRQFFSQSAETMELHNLISDHILTQFQARYLDFYRTTSRERYELLLHRCPGIVNDLPLNALASFLNITPKTLSMLRRDITFGGSAYPPHEILYPSKDFCFDSHIL